MYKRSFISPSVTTTSSGIHVCCCSASESSAIERGVASANMPTLVIYLRTYT